MKKLIAIFLVMIMAFCCVPTVYATGSGDIFAGGTGTAADPYQINTLNQLKDFRDSVNNGNNYQGKHIVLTADIDLNGSESNQWVPIGTSANKFNGSFSGKKPSGVEGKGGNYTISNLYINDTTADGKFFGLFGNIWNGSSEIKDLNINNATVKGNSAVAAFVGGGLVTLKNLHLSGDINIGTTTDQGHIANYNSSYIAGIVGHSYGSIDGCTVVGNDGSIIGGGRQVGGIRGFSGEGNNPITNCSVNNVDFAGKKSIGGIVGWSYGTNVSGCAVSDISVDMTATKDLDSIGLISGTTAVYNVPTIYKNNTVDANSTVTVNGEKKTVDMPDGVYGTYGSAAGIKAGDEVVYYDELSAAIAAVEDGDDVYLSPGTYEEGIIKLPASLTDVTIRGAEGGTTVLKGMTITSADGNTLKYDGLTFDNIVFDNSNILIVGWRSGEEIYKDLTIKNCQFKNVVRTEKNEAAVHINIDAAKAPVNGFTFENNVIDGVSGGQNSGIYGSMTGDIKIKDNTINDVAFRPYIVFVNNADGVSDNFIVEGNTFSGSSIGRAQSSGTNPNGTDNVNLEVSDNIFKDITDAQQICYWNFNDQNTRNDFSGNFFDIDIEKNPNKIYYNKPAQSVEDLVDMGVTPIYTDLNEDGTINSDSKVCVGDSHNFVPVKGKPATKQEEGVKEHLMCSICGQLRFDENGEPVEPSDIVIPKLTDATDSATKTGDDANLALWIVLMTIAVAGGVGTAFYRKRNNA